jgi:hypothetical protein
VNPPNIVVENSQGIRVIITLTTVLAIAAVIVRMWLYTFWKDYKSTLQFFIKQMEIQRNLKRHNVGRESEEGAPIVQRIKQESNG